MNKTIKTSHQISASTEKVWMHIKKGEGVDQWLPIISSCTLEGEGEGAKRTCIVDQGKMLETILKVDEENKLFQYRIDEQPLLPIDNIIGTMQVSSINNGTELQWDIEFTLRDESMFPMVKEAIEGLYSAGANGLETISNS
jgi:uncharacterized protein YndB with AHSA1/START domain